LFFACRPMENKLAVMQTIKSLAIGEQPSSDTDGDDYETRFVEN
ncbi:hypothetical protein Taro_030331, partial [Colocasia esculenta]|nr:hypothetical protein [Colocasia esculenta]